MKKPAFAGLSPQCQSGQATIYYGSVVDCYRMVFQLFGQVPMVMSFLLLILTGYSNINRTARPLI